MSSKTIAKNTLFLYFRMMLVLGVSLFTSRIVLRELGVSDYGIYSVVAGFISLFAFLNIAMSAATQRYLTFEIGKNDFIALRKIFSISLTIHFAIALIVLLLAETIGLWYINNKMVFPLERHFAVNIVYQLSIFSALLSIIQVPYNSLIIAHEKMNIYAYVGIVEAILKLVIVYLLVIFAEDKLIVFAILTFLVSFGIRLFYQYYCRKHYEESKYKFEWNKKYYKELITYSSWNLFGNLAVVFKGQGSNLVLNFFFGTTVNAAYGIMGTVNSAVNNFVSNFQLASNPQIIKLYAAGDNKSVEKLINQSTKFSFFLSLILIAPILLNTEYILKLWLVNPPKFSADFVRVILICSLIDVLSKSIMTGITATGKIKVYHVVIGLFNLLIVPISYFILNKGNGILPIIILYIWLFFSVLSFMFRLAFVRKLMNFNLRIFFVKVLFPAGLVSVFSFSIALILKNIFPNQSIIIFLLQTTVFIVLLVAIMYFMGMEKNERVLLNKFKNEILIKLKIQT